MACVYCVPKDGPILSPQKDLLGDDEILRLARLFVSLGIEKIRLTGGDPLVRPGIIGLAEKLAMIDGLTTLALSTNGLLLAKYAQDLKRIGVQAVNISLDSLSPRTFASLTGGHRVHRVLEGIDAALKAGLKVKLNAVALPTLEEADLAGFVRLSVEKNVEIRFIEYMPLCGDAFSAERFVPATELVKRLEQITDLKRLPGHDGVSRRYSVAGGRGKIGMIASISDPFCGACSRIRLSSIGKIQTCLFSHQEHDLMGILRNDGTDDDILDAIRTAAFKKPWGHTFTPDNLSESRAKDNGLIRMIGG